MERPKPGKLYRVLISAGVNESESLPLVLIKETIKLTQVPSNSVIMYIEFDGEDTRRCQKFPHRVLYKDMIGYLYNLTKFIPCN
jgi:hypothetical protein